MQRHALIIEDDVKNAAVLESLLSKEGFVSTKFTHPNQLNNGLAELASVNVVFIDLELPLINGYEIMEILKRYPNLQDVPYVACTVHTNEINTAYQEGFHSFLGKPLDVDKFPDQVRRIMRGEPVWDRNG